MAFKKNFTLSKPTCACEISNNFLQANVPAVSLRVT